VDLQDGLLRNARQLIIQISQTAICQQFHNVIQRLSRSLLIADDRSESHVLEITQESLSHALGIPRTTLNVAAVALQDAGLIRYRHGRLVIADRKGLEQTSCDCYAVISDLLAMWISVSFHWQCHHDDTVETWADKQPYYQSCCHSTQQIAGLPRWGKGNFKLAQEARIMRELRSQTPDFVAIEPVMQAILKTVERLARVDCPVLITGESGTGKELLARKIYESSPRNTGRFVAVNCGAMPEPLIETELFGYKRGAFTGAASDTAGLITQAHRGVLFLDEIGEMPVAMQVKLLRFLDSGEVRPVGSVTVSYPSVRVIAATNRVLEIGIESGIFRQDLYYRLAVARLHMPPLRERPADISALSQQCLAATALKSGRSIRDLSQEVQTALRAYSWPGNARELQNVIEQAVLNCTGDTVTLANLPELVSVPRNPVAIAKGGHGTRAEAAKSLGISRSTLWRRTRKGRNSETKGETNEI
jgi:transcriptional regulator with PAS, ATPase and Fis domain